MESMIVVLRLFSVSSGKPAAFLRLGRHPDWRIYSALGPCHLPLPAPLVPRSQEEVTQEILDCLSLEVPEQRKGKQKMLTTRKLAAGQSRRKR